MSPGSQLPVDPGLPVEIGRIDRELGILWAESGDTKTRASLINLAIYSESVDSVAGNTKLIAQIASSHACRALLILANPEAPRPEARAWISAHCHLAGKGERQVCSEQITFQLDGEMASALPNIVFAHLDSDLPLYFWWQGDFREPLDAKLWGWVDRLIYDSETWQDPARQLRIVQQIGTLTEIRTVLCDLAWARLLDTRFALAQLFDHSCALKRIESINRILIHCSSRTTGLLLLGWIAGQLRWEAAFEAGRQYFRSASGSLIEFEIHVEPGDPISQLVLRVGDATFEILRERHSPWYHALVQGEAVPEMEMLVPAGKTEIADVLLGELARGGRHGLYHKAIKIIAPLL